jgi:hypothetical protein
MKRFSIALSLFALLALAPACNDAAGGPSPDPQAASALASLESSAPAAPFEATPPIALAGDFRFEGQVEPVTRLTFDVVNMLMSGAATTLERLQDAGATCQLVVSNTYRCKKNKGPAFVPDSSLAALGAQDAAVFVTFGAQTAPPALVNDAPSLKEWQIFQTGTSSLGAFTGYRYLQLEGGLVKIIVPAATGSSSIEFIVKDATHLAKHETKNVTTNQWQFHQDTALVIFEP